MEWLVTLPRADVSAVRQNESDATLPNNRDQQLITASQQQTSNANVDDEGFEVLPPSTQRRLQLSFDSTLSNSAPQAASEIVILDAWVADLAKPTTVAYKKALESVSEDMASDLSSPGYWRFMQTYFDDLRLAIEAVQAKSTSRRKAGGGTTGVDRSSNEDMSAALNSAKAKLKALAARQNPPSHDHSWLAAPIFCLGWFQKEVSWWKAVERGLSEISSWFEPSLRYAARSTGCPVTFGDATAVIAAFISARGYNIDPVRPASTASSSPYQID